MTSKIFYINSTNRLSGSHSNFSYKLELRPETEFTHVAVMQAIIPKSYYLIQEEQNTITLNENGSLSIITIPIGNYTRSSFVSIFQTTLNASGVWNYLVSIDDTTTGPETGKLLFTVTGNSDIQPSFIFTTFLYEMLGFEQNSTISFQNNSLTSINVINMQKEASVFIRSDIVSNSGDNILQDVFTSNTSDYGNIIFQNENINYNCKKLNSSQKVYDFYLTDENNNPINLNGRNWQITICLFNKNDLLNIIKRYIQFKLTK